MKNGVSWKNKISVLVKRALAVVLLAAMFCTYFTFTEPEESLAKGRYLRVDNGLILKLTMGSSTTDNISYFAIKYVDNEGWVRTHFLRPTAEEINKGYGKILERMRIHQLLIASEKNKYFATNDEMYKKNDKMGMGFEYYYSQTKVLEPMDTYYFYFEPDFQFASIVGISFVGKHVEGGANEVSFQDISLYKVNYLQDVDMFGTFSSDYFIDFSGKRVMETDIQRPFNFTQADTLFDFDSLVYSDNTRVEDGNRFFSATYHKLEDVKEVRELDNSIALTVKIDFADVFGGGIEYMNSPADAKKTISDGWLREPMVYHILYEDNSGSQREIFVPIVMSSLYKAFSEGSDIQESSWVSGYMQQGDSVVFDVLLLDAKEFNPNSTELIYGRDLVNDNVRFYKNFQKGKAEDDRINLEGVTIYDTNKSKYKATLEDGFINAQVEGTPLYYYRSADENGTNISEESIFAVPLAEYTGTENLNRRTTTDKFIITLKTDSMKAAGTEDELFFKLRYKTIAGEERDTNLISVSKVVKDFYGYWPNKYESTSQKNQDFAYYYGASGGNEMSFVIEVPYVDSFIGATFEMNSDAKDEWQCSAIGIYELKEMGRRHAEYMKSSDLFFSKTNRVITRDFKAVNISPTLNGAVFVEPAKSIYVEFSSGSSVVEDNDIDWKEIKYQMSYEQACQNFGFTKARITYNVAVAVSGDLVNGLKNEDCGSKNQFYFKLVFEEGSSGYVLANQQLTSDGFTSGVTHVFSVTMNQDLGQLTAIKILPENTDEESDVYDKLKIDNITVSKSCDDGLAISWKSEINDWVSIEYKDSGAKNSVRGQTGNTESKLAQTFRVDSKGYAINMMFAIETIGYTDAAFEGRISAQIDYTNNKKELKTVSIDDLVGLMYQYAGKTPELKKYKPINDAPEFEAAAIDRNFFLSNNHIDRFYITLPDLFKVERITFFLKGTTGGRWNVGGISAYRVISKGNRALNENNEFVYNGEVELVAQTNNVSPFNMQYLANGNAVKYEVGFADNRIDVDMENTWISAISYVPQSNDDSLNIYAYMSSKAKNIGSYQLKARTDYSVKGNGKTELDSVAILEPDSKNGRFYAKDIKVPGLKNISKIGLKVDSFETQYAPCDYVVVEHIRSGVVINTYFFDFEGNDVNGALGYVPAKPSVDSINEKQKQTVTFMVSNDSKESKVVKDGSDLAVCLNYTSVNDPEGAVLTSPYQFVSDLGISHLKAGDIITFRFDQSYVKDVVGITFVAQGSLIGVTKIRASRVSLDVYDKEDNWNIKDIYSFGNEMSEPLKYAPIRQNLSAATSETAPAIAGIKKTVGILSMDLTTKDGSDGLSSFGKIRMKLGYNDDYNMPREMIIDDVSNLITSGSLKPGETAHLDVLVNGIQGIRYMQFEPYDDSSAVDAEVWTLESIAFELSISEEPTKLQRVINKTIHEGTPETIGFGNVKISVAAYISKPGTDVKERRGFSSASQAYEGILLGSENDIMFTPTIDGSISGMTVKCLSIGATADGKTVSGDVTNDVLDITYEGSVPTSFVFKTENEGDYRIYVTSQEISSVEVVINVSVTK